MSSTKRCSVSLPTDLVDQLDFVSGRLKVSRSACLSALLSEALPDIVQLVSVLPDDPSMATEADARRFRGVTADILSKQIGDLIRGGQDDLFKE
jgi:hypothetical protein